LGASKDAKNEKRFILKGRRVLEVQPGLKGPEPQSITLKQKKNHPGQSIKTPIKKGGHIGNVN